MTERWGGLAADAWGSPGGTPLVLLHGLTFDRRLWGPVAADAAGTDTGAPRPVVAFDLPGHGESDPQPSYAVDAVAATVHDAVTQVGLDPPVVVGHSVSGAIATLYAASYPVRGVVNVDQPLDLSVFADLVRSLEARLRGDEFPELWKAFEASFHTEVLPVPAQELVRSITRADRDLVLGYWNQIFETPAARMRATVDDGLAALRARGVPYTFVSGSEVDPAYAAWLRERLPQVEIVEWPNSSHFPHLAHPDAFVDLLRATAAW